MMNKSTFLLLLFIPVFVCAQNTVSTLTRNAQPGSTGLYSDTIEATHYTIFISNINVTSKTIAGYSKASLLAHYDGLSGVKLELSTLQADSVFVDNRRQVNFRHSANTITVPLETPLHSGDSVEVTVYYHGKTFVDPSGWGGFHFAGDYAFNLGVGFDAVPHNLGKAWFACIDDFRDRALYDVYATVPNDKKAISGGRLVAVVKNADSATSTWHWKTDFTLPTYLISLSTGNYDLVQDTYHGIEKDVPITLYCQPSAAGRVAATFINLKPVLRAYESHFGPYPFERVGYTATAQGAMEHAANISYPYSGWSGTTANDWWYAHELSHMWFGDMVTCASAADMWLNEGWAVWCESLVREALYGSESYKNNMRSKLKAVLQSTHVKDGGYYALYGIPQNITYGNTVYEKGGQVVHTLRNYLGDSLFFSGMRSYLAHFAYQPASSADMCDYLTSVTKVDLKPFFDSWVYSPGFPHFSIDSFACRPSGTGFDAEVFVRQKLKALPAPARSNHLEITFMDEHCNRYNDTLIFSGYTGSKIFHLPWKPVTAMADLDEKISDATTDVAKKLFAAGETEFEQTFAKVLVDKASDTAFVRITHNWVAPGGFREPVAGLRISDQHYWTVEGVMPDGFAARGRFPYSRSSFESIIQRSSDSLVVLYRKNAACEWRPAAFSKAGNWAVGTVTVDTLRTGEYALAVWDGLFLSSEPTGRLATTRFEVFPNPAHGKCTVSIDAGQAVVLQVYDTTGRLLSRQKYQPGKSSVTWSKRCRPAGTYLFKLTDRNGLLLETKKIVID